MAASASMRRDLPATLADIEQRAPAPIEIWYGHSILTAILFPAQSPDPGTEYVARQNGAYEYMLEAGVDPETKRREFPFGKYPRLLMAWLAKRIRMAGEKGDDVADPVAHTVTIASLGHLAEDLGLGKGGVTLKALQEQIRRVLLSHISIRKTSGFQYGVRHEVINVPLAKAVAFEDQPNQRDSSITIILDPEVYRLLAHDTAPFDTRATRILLSGRSVLAYDIYVWLVGSLYRLSHPMDFTWHWLYERFGDGISEERNFRQKFRKAMEKVAQVYPDVHFKISRAGLKLHPSPTAIAPRKPRQ